MRQLVLTAILIVAAMSEAKEVGPIPYPNQSQLRPQTDVFCYGEGGMAIEVLRGNNIYDGIAIVNKDGKQLEIIPVKATVSDYAASPISYQYYNGSDYFELDLLSGGQTFIFRMGQEVESGEAHCITPSPSAGGCHTVCKMNSQDRDYCHIVCTDERGL